ncbi:hypothetical protein H0X06_05335 [Candidatus Dependentiae bacterium]|nr:hypothetical protein [Candidatus Dependentiae bacterium]
MIKNIKTCYSIIVLGMTCAIESKEAAHSFLPPQKVDFLSSMGWDLEKNDTPKKTHYTGDSKSAQKKRDTLDALRKLYDKNYPSKNMAQRKAVIPKIIHQIWVGPKQPPSIFKKSQESIAKYHPDWEYKLWTDADIPNFHLHNKKFYDLSNNYGEKADILRYEILYRYGGIYLDVDFVCLKPLDVLSHYDLWTSLQPLDCRGDINNAVIGSVPGHPILKDCILTIPHDWYAIHDAKGINSVLDKVGPRHFQRSFMKFVNDTTLHIIAFPASFFHPIDIRDRLIGLQVSKRTNRQKMDSLIKPESFAVHYYAGSWWGSKRNEDIIK